MKKKSLLFAAILFFSKAMAQQEQQVYDDFEGNQWHYFAHSNGELDSTFINPDQLGDNPSERCARYLRSDTVPYDVIHMFLYNVLADVTNYIPANGAPPKIKMKVMTDAPIGTPIDLQLGLQDDDNYPTGVHSHFQAFTTVQNAWEELEFNFLEVPQGSMVPPNMVDRISIFFNPMALFTGHTFYFDDITGPEFIDASIVGYNETDISMKIYPNPASVFANIQYSIKKQENIQISLFDIAGNKIYDLEKGAKAAGSHLFTVDVSALPSGFYLYQISAGGAAKTGKLAVMH
jgi:hypothetical protein